MKKCADVLGDDELKRSCTYLLQKLIEKMETVKAVPVNERYTVGFMNGLAGVGYVLCEKRDGERIT